jgi:hypothetical protein
MVEASHEKENRAKETIQQLKLEISNLSRLVEQGMRAARDSAPPSPASVRHAQASARARRRIHGRGIGADGLIWSGTAVGPADATT